MPCSKTKKAACIAPECNWIVGKGCKVAVKDYPKGCMQSKEKKFQTRKSPSYPANDCCGQIRKGNDGLDYISKPNKNGVCRWSKVPTKDSNFIEFVEKHKIPKELHANLFANGLDNKDGVAPKNWRALSKHFAYIPMAGKHIIKLSKADLNIYKDGGGDGHVGIDHINFTKYRKPDWKRGDVIYIEQEMDDRNDGVLMWDGKKGVMLDYDYDEYGAVSSDFTVGNEFKPYYWAGQHIVHNNIIHVQFNATVAKQANKWFSDCTENEHNILSFKYDDQQWGFIYNFDSTYGNTFQRDNDKLLDKNGRGLMCYINIHEIVDDNKASGDFYYITNKQHFHNPKLRKCINDLLKQGVPFENILITHDYDI